MLIAVLRGFAIICVACVLGKAVAAIKLPSILGWLIAGMVFGPYLVEIVSVEITEALWYKLTVKALECFAGVMIGKEIVFKKLASSGKQIIGITAIQSIGTFLTVSAVFAAVFFIAEIPIYLAFVMGGIALATAPAPALSIVNEYRTRGAITQTLIPLAAIDDVIGVIVFFTVMSLITAIKGGESTSVAAVVGMVLLPFVIGIATATPIAFVIRKLKNVNLSLAVFIIGLLCAIALGFAADRFIFGSFSLNYLLIGMAASATVANLADGEKFSSAMKKYQPILTFSLIAVIVNMGMQLDWRLISGAGVFTVVYILSRAVGKIGFSYIGGKLTKAPSTVTKYLGLTLLPHSGVSLIFTGIATSTIGAFDAASASVISGTIAAAAIINEIVAVILAKYAFKRSGEINAP